MAQTQIQGEQLKDLTVNTADIADNAVTLAKMAQMSTANILGRNTAGTGNVESISMTTLKSMLSIPAGSDSQVQFNNSGALGVDSRFTFDVANGALSTGLSVYGTDGSMTVFSFTTDYPMLGLNDSNIFLGYDGSTGAYINLYNKGGGGHAYLTAGHADAGDVSGGNINLTPGIKTGDSDNGQVRIVDPASTYGASFDTHNLLNDRTYIFPDFNGTLALTADIPAIGGSDTYVQYNDGGLYGGDSGFTYDKTTHSLGVSGLLGVGNSPQTHRAINLALTDNLNLGAIYGIFDSITANGTTSTATALYVRASTSASAFTLNTAEGIFIANPDKGSGSTINNIMGLHIGSISGGASSNFAIYSEGGIFRSLDATDSTTYSTGSVVLDGGVGIAKNLVVGAFAAVGNNSGITSDTVMHVNHSFGGGTTRFGIQTVLGTTTSMGALRAISGGVYLVAGSYTVGGGSALYAASPSIGSGATLSYAYGLYVESITGGGNNYAIYTNVGQVRFGDTTDTTSSGTGGVVTLGGLSTTKAMSVGTNMSVGGDVYSNVKLGIRGSQAGHYGLYMGGLTLTPPASANGQMTDFRGTIDTGSSNTVPSGYCVVAGLSKTGSGTITNAYGLFVDNITVGGTNNYAIYTNTGMSRFGDSIAQVVTYTTNSVLMNLNAPSMGNGQSIALVIGKGYSAYNATVLDFMPAAAAANNLVGLGMAGIGYGLRIDGNLQVTIPTTTDSTSTTTGALAVAGGVGIAKGLSVGTVAGIGTVPNAGYGVTVAATTMAGFFIVTTALTNSANQFFTYAHRTSGTPADGFGIMMITTLQTTTTYDVANVSEVHSWATAAHATRKGMFIKYVYDTAGREVMRGSTNGSAPIIGFLGAAAVARQAVGAAAPAGGTGTAAGGYDTAANRNAMITLVNNMRTALINLGLCST